MITVTIATAVIGFGLGYLCREWEKSAEDAADRDAVLDATTDGCHPDDHELGRHSPGVGA